MTSCRRVWLGRLADWGVVALLGVALLVDLTGGFRATPLGVRVSVRSADRVLIWAVALAILRHALVPRPSMFEALRRTLMPDAESPRSAAKPALPNPAVALGAFACYSAVAIVLLYAQASNLYTVPDFGDPLFSIWRLAWIAHQLPRDPRGLFNANIFHPEPATLAYSDSILLPGAFAAPLIWAGVPSVVVYNLLLLATFAAAGASMFLLVRRLTNDWAAAAVAGLVFAFYPYRFSHYSHLELNVTMWMPLALLWMHQSADRSRRRDGVVLGLLVAAQTLSSIYYGLFFATYCGVVALVWCAAARLSWARLSGVLAVGAVVALLLIAPLAHPYLRARAATGARDRAEVAHYSARPIDYLAVHNRTSIYRPAFHATDNSERQLFPGLVSIAFAGLAAWPPFSVARLTYGAGVLFAFDASLGLNGVTYPWLYSLVPPFRGLRAPARFGMLVGLSLAVLAGLGVARATKRLARSRRLAVVAVCCLAVAAEAWPTLSLERVPAEPPAIYAVLPLDRSAVIVDLPVPPSGDVFWIDPVYMYYSTFHWHRLVNGNSGLYPRWYQDLRERLQRFPSDEAMRLLARHDTEFIVLHGDIYGEQQYRAVVSAADRRPDLQVVGRARCGGSECRAYRILRLTP